MAERGKGSVAYAGLWPRVVAFAVDYLAIAAYLVVLVAAGLVARLIAPGQVNVLFGSPLSGELTGFILITLPVTLYFALSESSARQASWGKRKLALRVTRADRQPLSRGRALGRTALKFVPWELAHACIWQVSFAGPQPSPIIGAGFALVWLLVGANVISLLASRKHQALYDWLAGSVVVRARAEAV
jgi:uncharacterized RDD family membrane protein YckC